MVFWPIRLRWMKVNENFSKLDLLHRWLLFQTIFLPIFKTVSILVKRHIYFSSKSKAAVGRCSAKHFFWKNSQNSQKSNCVGVSFLKKLQVWSLQPYEKEALAKVVIPLNFAKFLRAAFLDLSSFFTFWVNFFFSYILFTKTCMKKIDIQPISSNYKLLSIKVCVRYFLSKFYFSPNDSLSKTMKNIFYFI